MKKTTTTILIAIAAILTSNAAFAQIVRVKDIATIQDVRDNQLLGFGIIVGLEGTGDSKSATFTGQSVANMLQAYGIQIDASKIKLKNVASVMLTAKLPAFAKAGTTIDVVVSSLGDAKSLQGGTLLQTPLKAANGSVYAVAQGPVSVGGFSAGGGGASVTKNHPTVGRIPDGAIIERETSTNIASNGTLNLALNQNDFTTASRIADAINAKIGAQCAQAKDGNTIAVSVPSDRRDNLVTFISDLESTEVSTDVVAKVIVNERTGTVIVGGNVKLSPVAVSHGNLTVEISTNTSVSQPKPFSEGKTTTTADTSVNVKEQSNSLTTIRSGGTIDELVRALNALKVTPRDLIAILQALKEAGALKAQLEVI